MAKIYNSRAKGYETREHVADEPVQHLESEGERLIKEMVQKQLDTRVDLNQELKRDRCFQSVTDILPLTEYICGETTLKEFEHTAKKAAQIEELKSLGLSNEEIQNLLTCERDILTEKYKETDKSVLPAYLQRILEKVGHARMEHEVSQKQSSSSNNNRHQRELGRSVKPNSEHTKLFNFALSCQKVENDTRPLNHPINNLKNIEEELFGHIHKKPKKLVGYRPVKTDSAGNKILPCYSYQGGSSLWDVTSDELAVSSKRKISESCHTYTCKPEHLFTVKNGKIIQKFLQKCEENVKNENNAERSSDAYVVSNVKDSDVFLIPLENIAKNRLSLQEIKSIARFSTYAEGTPSKVLYVKNLVGNVTNFDLVSLFGHFDYDAKTRIVYRLLTGRMRGQAFITFPSILLAKEALGLVNGYVLKGQPIILQYGKGKPDVSCV